MVELFSLGRFPIQEMKKFSSFLNPAPPNQLNFALCITLYDSHYHESSSIIKRHKSFFVPLVKSVNQVLRRIPRDQQKEDHCSQSYCSSSTLPLTSSSIWEIRIVSDQKLHNWNYQLHTMSFAVMMGQNFNNQPPKIKSCNFSHMIETLNQVFGGLQPHRAKHTLH